MPQPKKGYHLGSSPSHQSLMLRNLAQSLFVHERIRTTEAKAKVLRPYAERLITKAKNGSVHNRRQVLGDIEDRSVVHKLFEEIGPRFAERNGGYTRILKLGPRNGDGAPMALIELVEGASVKGAEGQSSGRRRGRRRRPPAEAPAAASESEEPSLEEETLDAGAEVEGADEPVASAEEPDEGGGSEPVSDEESEPS